MVQQRPPSHRYQEEVRVGAVLPSSGVTYYEVPAEYGVRDYRYTVVNDRTALVDPRTQSSDSDRRVIVPLYLIAKGRDHLPAFFDVPFRVETTYRKNVVASDF